MLTKSKYSAAIYQLNTGRISNTFDMSFILLHEQFLKRCEIKNLYIAQC